MLSCYTPFLLAIVRRRVGDSAAAREQTRLRVTEGMLEDSLLSPGGAAADRSSGDDNGAIRDDGENCTGDDGGRSYSAGVDVGGGGGGNDGGVPNSSVGQVGEGGGTVSIPREEGCKLRGNVGPSPVSSPLSSSSCPSALCAEALRALSEYAVLSPGLAAADVLPLAEELATDTLEHAQVLLKEFFECFFYYWRDSVYRQPLPFWVHSASGRFNRRCVCDKRRKINYVTISLINYAMLCYGSFKIRSNL